MLKKMLYVLSQTQGSIIFSQLLPNTALVWVSLVQKSHKHFMCVRTPSHKSTGCKPDLLSRGDYEIKLQLQALNIYRRNEI